MEVWLLAVPATGEGGDGREGREGRGGGERGEGRAGREGRARMVLVRAGSPLLEREDGEDEATRAVASLCLVKGVDTLCLVEARCLAQRAPTLRQAR